MAIMDPQNKDAEPTPELVTLRMEGTHGKNQGRIVHVRVPENATIRTVKTAYQDLTGFPIELQRLWDSRTQAGLREDGKTLLDYNVRDASLIFVFYEGRQLTI